MQFIFHFLVIKALDPDPYWIRIRIGVQPKMLDPDEMNADPQPWFKNTIIYFINQEISAERERSFAIVSAP
jgi:hypothetical protein